MINIFIGMFGGLFLGLLLYSFVPMEPENKAKLNDKYITKRKLEQFHDHKIKKGDNLKWN